MDAFDGVVREMNVPLNVHNAHHEKGYSSNIDEGNTINIDQNLNPSYVLFGQLYTIRPDKENLMGCLPSSLLYYTP